MDPPNDGRYTDDDSGSPTQVNEGRSYDRYVEAPELPPMPLQDSDDVHNQSRIGGLNDLLDRSLDEADTGVVHFDSLDSGGLDFESPTTNDHDRRTDRPMTRFLFPNSDNEPPTTTGLETPAPPKNPFATVKNVQTPLLGGTQLFAQTPFSAAAGKPASPTSSRPSPSHALANMPFAGVSSPLKLHFLASDNDESTTPAPNIAALLGTSSQSRLDAITPFPAKSARFADGPLSSPSIHRPRRQAQTRTPTLLAEYEPMRQSQARRNAAELQPEPVDQDFGDMSSEDDIEDASQRRRRIVRRKRELGAKALSSISIAGPSSRQDAVEVPASTKKEGCEPRPRSKGRLERPCTSEALRQDHDSQRGDTVMDTEEQPDPAREAPPSGSETTYGDVSFPQSLIDAFNTKADAHLAAKTPTSSAVSLPEMGPPGDRAEGADAPILRSSLDRADAIPETSPATTRRKHDAPIVISSATKGSSQVNRGIDDEPILIVPASDDIQQHDLLPQRRTSRSQSAHELQQGRNPANPGSSWRSGLVQDSEADGTTSSPPVLAGRTFDSRSHGMLQRADAAGDQTPARPKAAEAVSTSSSTTGGTTSSLSSLSTTPTPPSREETPTTVNDSDMSALGSGKKNLVDSVEQQDDTMPQIRQSRRQRTATASLRKEPVSRNSPMAAATSTKRRASPFLSGTATNWSASSATAPAPDHSMGTSRRSVARSLASHKGIASSSFISTRRQNSAVPGVFAGMAFAISFQSRRTRGPEKETDKEFYEREQQSKVLSKRIQEAGGRILEDGFAELFSAPPVGTAADDDDDDNDGGDNDEDGASSHALQLRATAAATGFTALIADGHSRKTKYMQALALGLPCLAARWVTTCLELNTLVDWSPYLLCAGQSSFLGGAFCSQKVVPYDAAAVRLANVVNSNSSSSSSSGGARRLMDGMSVLLVSPRSSKHQQQHPQLQKEEESRTAPYIFLTHVLGARLSRVAGADEARRALLAREQAGRPFDWVYTDGEGDNGAYYDAAAQLDEVPAKARSRQKTLAGSKRKRAAGGRSGGGTATAMSGPLPRPVKLLSNERVIQSLIFGKFIEQDQLGG